MFQLAVHLPPVQISSSRKDLRFITICSFCVYDSESSNAQNRLRYSFNKEPRIFQIARTVANHSQREVNRIRVNLKATDELAKMPAIPRRMSESFPN